MTRIRKPVLAPVEFTFYQLLSCFSSESPDPRRAVTVEGDRAVFSKIMKIATSAVRNLWTAEGGGVCG